MFKLIIQAKNFLDLAHSKYNFLLCILILIFFLYPFEEKTIISHIIVSFFFAIFMLTIVSVIHKLADQKNIFRFYLTLIGISFLLRISDNKFIPKFYNVPLVISYLIFMFLIGSSVYIISREIFSTSVMTDDAIKGGVCVYFMIDFSWSYLYCILLSFDLHAFHPALEPDSRADLLYFSFSTLTTVGYGDITPASPLAKVSANLEAIIGTMYSNIFIARLVGLYSGKRQKL